MTVYCGKCGQAMPDEAQYCPRCGVQMQRVARPIRKEIPRPSPPIPRRREDEFWGLVSFGGFLVILAVTFFAYPDLITRIVDYLTSFSTPQGLVLPTYNLGVAIIFFCNVAGVWGFVQGGLRFIFSKSVRNAIGDMIGGAFSFYVAYIFVQFYSKTITGGTLVGLFFVGLAGVIILNAAISISLPSTWEKQPPPPQAQVPPATS